MKRQKLWAIYGLLLGFVLGLAGGAGAGMIDLGDLGGGSSRGTAINNAGQIVGYSTITPYGATHAFLYEDGVMTDLGSGAPNDINDSGQIVGPGLYDNGAWINLGGLGGLLNTSAAFAINNAGQIVGAAYLDYFHAHAFLYDNGKMTDLGTLGGDWSQAYDINNSGQIVGFSQDASGYEHAFLYENGKMTDLGTLGGLASWATSINDSGQVVGVSTTASNELHPFLYTYGGPMMDLGTGDDSYVVKINNSGQIVGYIRDDSTGNKHAFIL